VIDVGSRSTNAAIMKDACGGTDERIESATKSLLTDRSTCPRSSALRIIAQGK
jgi:hypothetical protein